MSHSQVLIDVVEPSQIGAARRAATRIASGLGCDEQACGAVAIAASELATNLARHSRQGQLFIQPITRPSGSCVELLAVDRGPGITDVQRSLQDGFSTAGTSGTGLGAVRRLSRTFDIYSAVDVGTVVLSRLGARETPERSAPAYEWGAVSTCAPTEQVCGDAYSVVETNGRIAVMLTDGLGHGPLAHEPASDAVESFRTASHEPPAQILDRTHRRLRGSRGAAAAVSALSASTLWYAGVGNIAGSITGGERNRGLTSQNGTLGLQVRRIQEFSYDWPPGGILVMHSDGLSSRWTMDRYPGLRRRHPAVIAAVLWRDCLRGKDDASVVVVVEGPWNHG
jgi:anti-sigma regulatory factor (Ser/Thr protein kinase)